MALTIKSIKKTGIKISREIIFSVCSLKLQLKRKIIALELNSRLRLKQEMSLNHQETTILSSIQNPSKIIRLVVHLKHKFKDTDSTTQTKIATKTNKLSFLSTTIVVCNNDKMNLNILSTILHRKLLFRALHCK